MDNISVSERKRLQSLKEKKESFRAKEQVIQNALKDLDNSRNRNKIIFDENIDDVEEQKLKKKGSRKRRDLFENDDSNDDNETKLSWDNNSFNIKECTAETITGNTITFGNDERFKLDKRFVEDNNTLEENDTQESNDISDLQKEKELQLDILENVLGVPIGPKTKNLDNNIKSTKKVMIRYDPTESHHKEYEIIAEKSETKEKKPKKKKLKDMTVDVAESAPVEVSKDIYFSVSNTLSTSLKEGGQFSLLKTYGKEEDLKHNDTNPVVSNVESVKNFKHQFNFDTKNPFKYDSSDSENESREETTERSVKNNDMFGKEIASDLFIKTNNFFFHTKDSRFNEAIQFFSKESIPIDEFKNLRPELKQIVRSKIRQNIKKNQPWGNKKKVKRLS